MPTSKKAAPKKAAKKAAPVASSKKKSTPDAPNGPSSKEPQSYGGNQSVPLHKRENGGRLQ